MHILNNLPREKIVHQFDTDFTSFFTIDSIARIDKVFEYYSRTKNGTPPPRGSDPTLRNTIADYHTRYQRPCPACDTSTTLGNGFQLSFASFVRRVAFLDRNNADVLLRIYRSHNRCNGVPLLRRLHF